MLILAQTVVAGALSRDESRGAHYKPEFPDRDDAHWLKTTKADYTPDGPRLSYEAVDTSLIAPRPRVYDIE
ncbi:MAG TPA: succinate dehydrogenase flavoprotein subunit, partial [Nitrospirota bacterium]